MNVCACVVDGGGRGGGGGEAGYVQTAGGVSIHIFSSKLLVMDTCLPQLSSTINALAKWLTSMSISMQNHSGEDSVALGMGFLASCFPILLGIWLLTAPLWEELSVKHA